MLALSLIVVTAVAAAFFGLATVQRRRAAQIAAGITFAVSAVTTGLVALEVRPFFSLFEEGGVAAIPPVAVALYGIGSAIAWYVSRSRGSLIAAQIALIAAPVLGFINYQRVMAEMREVVLRAPEPDRTLILNACSDEAMRMIELGGGFAIVGALILLFGSRSRPQLQFTASQQTRVH